MQLRDAVEANNVTHERFHGMQQSWIIRDPVLVATTDYMDTELNLVSMLWRTRKNTERCIFPLAVADGVNRNTRTCSQAKYTAISGLASGCRPPETGAAWNPRSWQYLIATALQQTIINYSYSRSICFYKFESIREERTHTLE